MWKTILILLSVLVSVATAQMITETLVGISSTGEVESWQVEAVKYEGDKFIHWHFQPTERRFRFSEHEWIESWPQRWFNAVVGIRYLKERICDVCLRWEILIWKSSPSPSAESALGNFEELVKCIQRKKARE